MYHAGLFSPPSPIQSGTFSRFAACRNGARLSSSGALQYLWNCSRRLSAASALVRRPVQPLQNDEMLCVNLSNCRDQAAVQRQQERRILPENVRQRLIEQVIPAHGGLVPIALCQKPPHFDQRVLMRRVCKQLRPVVLAVVDVLSRLPARCAVHIEHDVNAVSLAPCDAGIDKMQRRCTEGDRSVGCSLEKQTRVEREPHGIHPLCGDPRNVCLRDIGREILLPERCGIFRAA